MILTATESHVDVTVLTDDQTQPLVVIEAANRFGATTVAVDATELDQIIARLITAQTMLTGQ
ncbi:hypothetical protein ACFO5K_04350 [Nocardia halotolerans]|uniref:Uncharacterized protein n=1 Tax=Nocardia halotolerans TaxID=1755878 RepID=A0ABV8VF30_9NOCA